MKYIKMFIAGIALPSTVIPFLLCLILLAGKPQILTLPFVHFIPLFWGIWNILYFTYFAKIKLRETPKLLLTGAVLGLLVACIGVFWLHLPTIIGLSKSQTYLPLIIVPILYAILWRYIVKRINHLLGLI